MPYPSLDNDPAHQDFLAWIGKNCKPGLIDPASKEPPPLFLPAKVLQHYFRDNNYYNLNKLLRASFPNQEIPVDADKVADKCAKVFCTLLVIGKSQYIQRFMPRDHLQDTHLPFDVEYPPPDFPVCATDQDPKGFLMRFCEEQWMVCAPEIELRVDRNFEAGRILPLEVKKQLGRGQSANLYETELHPTYNQLAKKDSQDSENRLANKVVLKTYFGRNAERYFKNEVNAFKKIRSSPGMIDFYGGFTQGKRFHILLEFADKGTLEEYFKKTAPPTSGENVIKFWEHLFDLVVALLRIHEAESSPTTSDPQPLQGWHQDVKPANILVTTLGRTWESKYDWKFKLADLGDSHFKRINSPAENGTDQDSQGTKTYGAPECCRTDDVLRKSRIQVSPTIDIWSLGGVFSEAAAWLVGSYEQVRRYRRERRAATKNVHGLQDGGCFHDGKNVLSMVKDYHKGLAKELHRHDCITKRVLDMVEDSMLVPEATRKKSIDIWRTCLQILSDSKSELEMRRPAGNDPRTPIHFTTRSLDSSASTSLASSPHDSRHDERNWLDEFSPVLSPKQISPLDSRDQPVTGDSYNTMRRIGSDSLGGTCEQSTGLIPTQYGTLDSTAQIFSLNPHLGHRAKSRDIRSTQPMHNTTQSMGVLNAYEGEEMHRGPGWVLPGRPAGCSMPLLSTRNGLSDEVLYRPINQGSVDPAIPAIQQPPASFPRNVVSGADSIQSQGYLRDIRLGTSGANDSGQVRTHSWAHSNLSQQPTVPMPCVKYDNQEMSTKRWAQDTLSMGHPGGDSPSQQQPTLPITYPDHATADYQEMPAGHWNQNMHSMGHPGGISPPSRQTLFQQHMGYQSGKIESTQHSHRDKLASASQSDSLSYQDVISKPPEPSNISNRRIKTSIPPAILPMATAIDWRLKRGRIEDIQGYHLFDRLKTRDHEFLIDDALSMLPYWNNVESVFGVLAYLVKAADPDGIGLRFTSSQDQYNSKSLFGRNSSTKLVEQVHDRRRKIQGTSNITYQLGPILETYITKLRDASNLKRGGTVRKLNLYVLTDGVWEDKCDPSLMIGNLVAKLKEFEYTEDSKQVGIQFISFGNHPTGLKRLQDLDDNLGLTMDIIDTTRFDDNVWKMLLGAIDKTFDESRTTI